MVFGKLPLALGLVTYLRDEGGKQTEPATRLHVEPTIADDGATSPVEVELLLSAREQLGLGFAARASVLGPVRAVVERIDTGARSGQTFVEARVDSVHVLPGVEPSPDPGLVRHAYDAVAVRSRDPDRFAHAPQDLEPVRVGEIVEIRYERSIPVDEERRRGRCAGHRNGSPGPVKPLGPCMGVAPLPPVATADQSAVSVAFDRTMERLRNDPSPLTVLFSGGVDSSLVAHALRGHPDLELLTVGTAASHDMRWGKSAAGLLGLPWCGAVVGPRQVDHILEQDHDLLEGTEGTLRAVAVSFAVALRESRPSRVVTAQGVDELFLGYAHFRGLEGEALERKYRSDLATLLEREWPRALQMARREGRTLVAPFLEPDLLAASRSLPLRTLAWTTEAKPWLRRWAEERGLPPELAHRPKKALQYGSGIGRMVSEG